MYYVNGYMIVHRALVRGTEPAPAGSSLSSVSLETSVTVSVSRPINPPGLYVTLIEAFTTTMNIRVMAYNDSGTATQTINGPTLTMAPGDEFYIGVQRIGDQVTFFTETTGPSDRVLRGTMTLTGAEVTLYDDGNHRRVGMQLINRMQNDKSIISNAAS